MQKLSLAVVKRFLRFLEQSARKDPEKFMKFYTNYSYYLKAGLIEDRETGGKFKGEITKLLRYECTKKEAGEMISLQEYADEHMQDGKQKNIYYFCAPNRETAMNSPYLEQFRERGRNVILMYDDIDEYVVGSALDGFKDHQLISVDAQDKDFELDIDEDKVEKKDKPCDGAELGETQKQELQDWIKEVLGQRVMEVKFTDRLVSSPAVVTSVMTPHMRKMMKSMMAGQGGGSQDFPMTLELSANHPTIKTLYSIREENAPVAKMAIDILFDNAAVAAGMIDEPRSVLPRSNKLLEMFVYQGAGFDYATNTYFKGEKIGEGLGGKQNGNDGSDGSDGGSGGDIDTTKSGDSTGNSSAGNSSAGNSSAGSSSGTSGNSADAGKTENLKSADGNAEGNAEGNKGNKDEAPASNPYGDFESTTAKSNPKIQEVKI